MEVLQPIQSEQKEVSSFEEHPKSETAPNLTHIQMLAHLDMKESIFDDRIMEKVKFIADRMNYEDFEKLSLKIGNDSWATSKLDKIYYHIKLSDAYMKGEEKQRIIREQLNQYE